MKTSQEKKIERKYEAEFAKAAKAADVPLELLRAICWAESHHNSLAYVYSDGGEFNHAVGICQVLVNTGKTHFKVDDKCHRDFRKNKGPIYIPKTHEECQLFGVYTNILAAAKYLKYQLDRYNGSWISATAAYNSGTVKTCKTGVVKNKAGKIILRCTPGNLINESYVNKVMKALEENR